MSGELVIVSASIHQFAGVLVGFIVLRDAKSALVKEIPVRSLANSSLMSCEAICCVCTRHFDIEKQEVGTGEWNTYLTAILP